MRAASVLSSAVAPVMLAGLVGCSDAFLQPPPSSVANADDRLAVTGRVCTSAPVASGFPVKVVMLVDQSGSMCVSDPPGSQLSTGFCEQATVKAIVPPGVTQPARVRAVLSLLDQFSREPNVQVALVPFETNVKGVWPTSATSGGANFARPDQSLVDQVNQLQSQLGKGTDYQGALATAYAMISSDIAAVNLSDPAQLPRTRYVVVFLTDGTPYPRCAAEDNLTQYADDLHPDLLFADSATDFCNELDPTDPNAITGGPLQTGAFLKGTDRNQNYQLYSYVDQLMELKAATNVGDIRLNTVLLFNEEAVRACGPICQDLYGLYVRYPGKVPVADGPAAAKTIATYVLQQLANRGNGVFQIFSGWQGLAELNLGSLNYTSLAARNVMKNLIVQALTSEPGPVDLKSLVNKNDSQTVSRVIDSDGDGLPDLLDNNYTYDTSPYDPDSDRDGFSDSFEVLHASDGFRPDVRDGRGCIPDAGFTSGCIVADTDGDGLSQYAETYLKTRSTLVDSDGDGIPDGMEARYGLDPLKAQSNSLDTDDDGVSDFMEFRLGSNPVKRDNEFIDKYGYQYTITADELDGGATCYDFTVSNIQMVTPPPRAGVRQGYNLFKVWFDQAPESGVGTDYGDWKVGCVWAEYAPPTVRVPAGPTAPAFADSDFKLPYELNDFATYETHCLGVSPTGGK